MKVEENVPAVKNTRMKILMGIGILSIFPLLKFSLFGKKKNAVSCSPADQEETVRLLTQDGRLVDVKVSKLGSARTKVSDKELLAWVKK